MNILKQIKESNVYCVISRTHDEDDFANGDLSDRIEEYKYFNHIVDFPLSKLNPKNYDIDEDKVEELMDLMRDEIEDFGSLQRIPKITIDKNGDIIDGCHRALAMLNLGYEVTDLLQGTNVEFKPEYKKECVDEDLQIYKYSNEFGSISVMENAKYSPADNSVSEFLVKDEYRGLGVGTELLKMAMDTYSNLGAQVSSKASLKVFLECGHKPFELESKLKSSIDPTSYDFKTFNKAPELLSNRCAYTVASESFDQMMEESIKLFNDNGGSLYMVDKRDVKPDLKKKRRSTLRP